MKRVLCALVAVVGLTACPPPSLPRATPYIQPTLACITSPGYARYDFVIVTPGTYRSVVSGVPTAPLNYVAGQQLIYLVRVNEGFRLEWFDQWMTPWTWRQASPDLIFPSSPCAF